MLECDESVFRLRKISIVEKVFCTVQYTASSAVDPLVPRVVLEKPQFSTCHFLKTLFAEIRDTINSIQPYKCKHNLIKKVSLKSW